MVNTYSCYCYSNFNNWKIQLGESMKTRDYVFKYVVAVLLFVVTMLIITVLRDNNKEKLDHNAQICFPLQDDKSCNLAICLQYDKTKWDYHCDYLNCK